MPSCFLIRNLAVVSVGESGAGAPIVKQRGVDWLIERIQHTAGIYRFLAEAVSLLVGMGSRDHELARPGDQIRRVRAVH